MGSDVFDYPKDVDVLARFIEAITDADDIILDCFAGSGSTGHAVMAINAARGSNRRFILVQLPEPLDPENAEHGAAIQLCTKSRRPQTIAELTKERLARASKKIREDSPLFHGDLGFRVYKLDSSNIREWDPKRDDMAATLDEHAEHLKTGRSETDILTELLLKLGLDLCVPIELRTISGVTVYSIGAGTLFACLSKAITRAQVKPLGHGILAWRAELKVAVKSEFVFRDSAFADDVAKTNLAAYLEQNLSESQRGRIRSL
jgi:adenine-specific DNA-methyltransferase